MAFHKLSSTEGFIAFDLDEAPAVGVVRLAPKVLRDGAELLARSTTYAAASFGLNVGGGSAGISSKPEDRDAAVKAFLEEVAPLVEQGRWLPGPGSGMTPADLSALGREQDRARAFDPVLAGRSAAAAAAGALGGLEGKRLVLVGAGPALEAAADAVTVAGGSAETGSFDSAADALLVAGKAGVLEHDLAETASAAVVVPVTPVPVTARALAVLGRAGIVVVPDFLSTAAPLLAALDAGSGDPLERVRAAVAELASEGTGMWRAAVLRAEAHLRTWQDELPFGRPLA